MSSLRSGLLAVLIVSSFSAKAMDDIVLHVKIQDPKVSTAAMDRLRTIISKASHMDFLHDTAVNASDDPVVIKLEALPDSVDPTLKEMIQDIGSIMEFDLVHTQLRLTMPTLNYDVSKMMINLDLCENGKTPLPKGMTCPTRSEVNGDFVVRADVVIPYISIKVSKLDATFVENGTKVRSLFTADHPTVEFKSDANPLRFVAILTGRKVDQGYKFDAVSSNFVDAANTLKQQVDHIDLQYKSLKGEVVVRAGQHQTRIDWQGYLDSQKKFVVGGIIGAVADSLNTSLGPQLLQLITNKPVSDKFSVVTDSVFAQFELNRARVPSRSGDEAQAAAEILFSTRFCTAIEYTQLGDSCVQTVSNRAPVRTASREDLEASLAQLNSEIDSGANDVAASMSEEMINRGIQKLVESGMFEDTLKPLGARIGPNGAFMLFDQDGGPPKMILDLIVPIDASKNKKFKAKFEEFLIGRSELRFPLVMHMAVGLRAGKTADGTVIPEFFATVVDVPMEQKILKKGILTPYSTTDLGKKAFRGAISKLIIRRTKSLVGKAIPPVPLPSLQGLGLENAKFKSDGHGRILGSMRLVDLPLNGGK